MHLWDGNRVQLCGNLLPWQYLQSGLGDHISLINVCHWVERRTVSRDESLNSSDSDFVSG